MTAPTRSKMSHACRAGASLVFVGVVSVLVACGDGAISDAAAVAADGGEPADAGAEGDGGIPGYIHTLARSRFQIGKIEEHLDQFGMHKTVGSKGTFASEVASQAATAIPNGDVVSLAGSPTGQDPAAQGKALIQYLGVAGLPSDQMASVREDTAALLIGHETVMHPALSLEVPILTRQWKGIPIDDSTAWAFLSNAELSYAEQVFWPAIGQDVVDDVHRLQALVADPTKSARLFAALPPGESGAVVIHHTSWYWQGPFRAVACYRLLVDGVPMYFDINGHVVSLPTGTTDAG
jgi:hypothetical protein